MLILRDICKTIQRYLRLRLTEVTEVLFALIHSAFTSKSVISVYNNKVLHQRLSDKPPTPVKKITKVRRRVAEHREMLLLSYVAVFPAARDHDLPHFLLPANITPYRLHMGSEASHEKH